MTSDSLYRLLCVFTLCVTLVRGFCATAYCSQALNANQFTDTIDSPSLLWRYDAPFKQSLGLGCTSYEDYVVCTGSGSDIGAICLSTNGTLVWSTDYINEASGVAARVAYTLPQYNAVVVDNRTMAILNGSLVKWSIEGTTLYELNFDDSPLILTAIVDGGILATQFDGLTFAAIIFPANVSGNAGTFHVSTQTAVQQSRAFLNSNFYVNGELQPFCAVIAVDSQLSAVDRLVIAWEYQCNGTITTPSLAYYNPKQNVLSVWFSRVQDGATIVSALSSSKNSAKLLFEFELNATQNVQLCSDSNSGLVFGYEPNGETIYSWVASSGVQSQVQLAALFGNGAVLASPITVAVPSQGASSLMFGVNVGSSTLVAALQIGSWDVLWTTELPFNDQLGQLNLLVTSPPIIIVSSTNNGIVALQ